MKLQKDIIDDIYPKSLLARPNTMVQVFDNKFDFIEHLDTEEAEHGQHVQHFLARLQDGPKLDPTMVETVRNTVRNNLVKRGIVTGTIYEGYKYAVDGLILDHAELAAGNSECMMSPVKKYDKWFYELYVNMSIPWSVDESEIQENAIKLIETIKLLEERNIEIKINVILFSDGMFRDGRNYLSVIPICSHLDYKDYNLLSFMDGKFLRGPLFQIMKSHEVTEGLGRATKLDNSVNLWELEETELAERVLNDLNLDLTI